VYKGVDYLLLPYLKMKGKLKLEDQSKDDAKKPETKEGFNKDEEAQQEEEKVNKIDPTKNARISQRSDQSNYSLDFFRQEEIDRTTPTPKLPKKPKKSKTTTIISKKKKIRNKKGTPSKLIKLVTIVFEDQFDEASIFALKFLVHELSDLAQDLSLYSIIFISNVFLPWLNQETKKFSKKTILLLTYWTVVELAIDGFFLYFCIHKYNQWFFEGDQLKMAKMFQRFSSAYKWNFLFGIFTVFGICFYVLFNIKFQA
jgi:hypothetical protein